KALDTRSLLIIPIMLNERVLGLLGLHDTKRTREWQDEEVAFLQSVARQLAVGYNYTTLYVAQEQESKRTNALLEIANMLNSHSTNSRLWATFFATARPSVGRTRSCRSGYGYFLIRSYAGRPRSLRR